MDKLTIEGIDNYKNPRQNFADKIAGLDDDAFMSKAEETIWLSAYATNNAKSDYHWQADACYDEAARRGNPELYNRAWKQAAGKA